MALVIIDMQEGFSPTVEKVEKAVLSLIRLAKGRREAIFVLTFSGCGSTLSTILEAVKGYPLAFHVRKGHADGSIPLARMIARIWERGLIQRFSKMRFCGVYTSQCVKQTFLSMCERAVKSNGHHDKTAIHKNMTMELVTKACRESPYYRRPAYAIEHIKKQRKQFPNLRVA